MSSNHTHRREVRKGQPCPVCNADHSCSVGEDGLIFCRHRSARVAGFVYLGQAEKDPQWGMYRREGDRRLYKNNGNGHSPRPSATGTRKASRPRAQKDWNPVTLQLAEGLTEEWRVKLADALGLPRCVLDALPLLGVTHNDRDGSCWTFPEVDGQGVIVGIQRRYLGGEKRMRQGSKRGLTVPKGWKDRSDVIWIVEGASDTLTLTAMNLSAIGRPFNTGGVEELAELLSDCITVIHASDTESAELPTANGTSEQHNALDQAASGRTAGNDQGTGPAATRSRPIVVVGEYDCKPNGEWPGLAGCKQVAAELQARLGRPVGWALPPNMAKDARTWFLAQEPDLNLPDELHALGESFTSRVEVNWITSSDNGLSQPGLDLESFDSVISQPIHWLVPAYVPLGKLFILAGDGGVGKSLITIDVAARLSRGEPCFGLAGDQGEACDILIANCEDDPSDTIAPRLRAARADLSRVHRIKGIVGTDGKPLPFSLVHLEAIKTELQRRPDVRLIVIDPAGAFTGGPGFDDHRDSEVRKLLGPLSELAGQHRVTVLLVMHMTKGTSMKAVHKVMGSSGYTNASRAAFGCFRNPKDEQERLLLPLKFNCGEEPAGLKYHVRRLTLAEQDEVLAELGDEIPEEDRPQFRSQLHRVEWRGETDQDADSVVKEEGLPAPEVPGTVQQAADWLKGFLAQGPRTSRECVEEGNRQTGLDRDAKWWRIKVLQGMLSGRSEHERNFRGGWLFLLADQELPRDQEDQESQASQESQESQESKGPGLLGM